MRDVLGVIYDNHEFAPLFSPEGRPAETPWRLALVIVMQFSEGLSDRQATEAVRARIGWKYGLGLELSDPGFDHSVLCEFRARLIQGAAEHLLLDTLLTQCTARGLLKARSQQRTDSTHVLMAVRALKWLERVSETLRQALNALADVAPDWLRAQSAPEWFARYGRRIEEYRLPQGKEAPVQYAVTVGADGMHLLDAVYAPSTPAALREVPTVELLRRVWIVEYQVVDGRVELRAPNNMPLTNQCIESPYDPDARYSAKRTTEWIGFSAIYKVHITETCDDDTPHLLTHVETTMATEPDVTQLAPIHDALAAKHRPPVAHIVDAGYPCAQNLVTGARDHAIDVVGPVYEDRCWQAQASQGYDLTHFAIDWEAGVVTCPQGHHSIRWCETHTARHKTMIHVDFAAANRTPCPMRALCTRVKTLPRPLTLQPQAEHAAIQAARQSQQRAAFPRQYARRAGIEGTLAQGVRVCGLRSARYCGRATTHLQHLATAALNVSLLSAWRHKAPRAHPSRTLRRASSRLLTHSPPWREFANGIVTGLDPATLGTNWIITPLFSAIVIERWLKHGCRISPSAPCCCVAPG